MARGSYEGLARFATISAIVFGVSLGLCGATFLIGGLNRLGDSLMPMALLELGGMVVGALGLVGAGAAALIRYISSLWSKGKDPHE